MDKNKEEENLFCHMFLEEGEELAAKEKTKRAKVLNNEAGSLCCNMFLEKEEELRAKALNNDLKEVKKNLEENKKKLDKITTEKEEKMFANLKKSYEEESNEIEKRKKEREEKLANLNIKKKKVINGLKEVKERIMALSPSSDELDLAIENIKKREKENQNGVLLEEQIFKDLKNKVREEQKNYKNERVFQKFEDNMKVLDKYMNHYTDIERYDEEIIKVDIKDQNKISKTQNKESKDQNRESKDQNKISEEKTDGFGEYIASSTKNMKRMVEENTIINDDWKDSIIGYIDCIENFCKDIDETQNEDPNTKKKKKEEFILLCDKIEEFWKKYNNKGNYNNKKKYNNKQKGIKPEENREEEEEEGKVFKGQQHRKDKFLAKLHRFENFVENCAFGTTPIEQLEAINEEKKEKEIEEGKDILNKKEKEKNELIDNIINNETKIKEKKGKGEEIISTKGNAKEIKIENNNNEELKVTEGGDKKSDNIEKEVINNQKRSTEEIISKGNLFDEKEKGLLLKKRKNWHFDKNGKIVMEEDEEEIINNEQNDNDKNDDKSLINLIESQEYKDMRNRALGKDEGKEEQKDEEKVNAINLKIDNRKSIDKNIIKKDVVEKQQHNAEYVLKEGLQLDMIAKMKENREISEEVFCSYGKSLEKHYPNLLKKNSNYIKTVNNVVENEKERYEKLINTYKREISKISPLILLRGFGRFAISFLFSTINSIMQFERKDVIGPYFSFYTLSFGRIVQPSFLRENIYIDISLSLLSLLIFSAVDSKIDGYYLSHYKITSPLCRFLSLIKYTTNAFNININFFVNKDFYMSFNIMSIFDSILSWYWFNKSKFEEKIKKEIKEYNTQRNSIKQERKVKSEILVSMLNKQKETWEKHHVKDFFRRIVAKNLFENRKRNNEENKEENNIDNIDKKIDDDDIPSFPSLL